MNIIPKVKDNKKTAKHEIFHLAFNRLSKEKQEELLNEGSKLFGIPVISEISLIRSAFRIKINFGLMI